MLFLAFFGSLVLAAHRLPTPYDWRYRVISNLLSPRDNPGGFWIPCLGISGAGLLMLPFVARVRGHLSAIHQAGADLVSRLFHLGIFALILSAVVVPQHTRPFLGSTRWHEYFADLSALGFATGMIGSCRLARRSPASSSRPLPRRFFLLLWCWRVLTFLPVAGVVVCEACLEFSQAHFAASKTVRECLRHSVFWHLGFWEWTGAAAVFLFWGGKRLAAALLGRRSRIGPMYRLPVSGLFETAREKPRRNRRPHRGYLQGRPQQQRPRERNRARQPGELRLPLWASAAKLPL